MTELKTEIFIDIPISAKTRKRFDKFKRPDETDNDAMKRLIDFADKYRNEIAEQGYKTKQGNWKAKLITWADNKSVAEQPWVIRIVDYKYVYTTIDGEDMCFVFPRYPKLDTDKPIWYEIAYRYALDDSPTPKYPKRYLVVWLS